MIKHVHSATCVYKKKDYTLKGDQRRCNVARKSLNDIELYIIKFLTGIEVSERTFGGILTSP